MLNNFLIGQHWLIVGNVKFLRQMLCTLDVVMHCIMIFYNTVLDYST